MHFAIVEDLVMDQKHLIRLIQENLEKYHETADFDCFENGEDFLAHFRPGLYHAVFMDIMLDRTGLNGIETAEKLPCPGVLMKSAHFLPSRLISRSRNPSVRGRPQRNGFFWTIFCMQRHGITVCSSIRQKKISLHACHSQSFCPCFPKADASI